MGLIIDVRNIEEILRNLNLRVNSIEMNCCNGQPNPEVQIPSVCIISPSPVGGVPVSTLLSGLELAFCSLRTSTGSSSAIFNAINKQCPGLDTSPSLGTPNVNMGSLPGWVTQGNYANLANSINNMWITICDMRTAVLSIQATQGTGCSQIIINMNAVFNGSDTITIFFTGSVPAGFSDCAPSGNQITIRDCFGNTMITNIPVITYVNNPAGYPILISATALTLACDFSIQLDGCWENLATNTTCERQILTTITNTTACPTLTTTPTTTTVPFSFTNSIATPITYDIQLYAVDGVTLVSSTAFVNPGVGLLSGTFTALTDNTVYKIRVKITVGAIITYCPFGTISTLPGNYWLWTDGGDPGFFLQDDGTMWLIE